MIEKLIKAIVVTGVAAGVALGSGCLTRPVVNENPTTKTSFTAEVKQQNIDKVDLLFAIDNSASMGDKQQLLSLAVPVLVNRLLNPNCVSTQAGLTCKQASDCTTALGATAQCDPTGNSGAGVCFVPGDSGGTMQCSTIMGSKPEFPPVHDMHIGIVSSSLGGGGSPDICVVSMGDPTHQDDMGHLLNRTLDTMTNGDGPHQQREAARRQRRQLPRVAAHVVHPERGQDASQRHHLQRRAGHAARHGLPIARVGRAAARLRPRGPARELVPLPRSTRSLAVDLADDRLAAEGAAHRLRHDAAEDASRLPPARLARRHHPDHRRRGLVERSALARRLRLGRAYPDGPRRSRAGRSRPRHVRV